MLKATNESRMNKYYTLEVIQQAIKSNLSLSSEFLKKGIEVKVIAL